MKTEKPFNHSIREALQTVRRFITETTGKPPTDQEIADALKRYFVLNEIKAHILMVRDDKKTGQQS